LFREKIACTFKYTFFKYLQVFQDLTSSVFEAKRIS